MPWPSFLILALCAPVLFGGEYVFSYRLGVRNGVILNEKYYFSHAMLHSNLLKNKKSSQYICEIAHGARSEKEFIASYKQEVLECLFQWGIALEDHTKKTSQNLQSTTLLSIPPTRIYIDFAQGLAQIVKLESH